MPWSAQIAELQHQNETLVEEVAELQHTITITTNTGEESSTANTGNSYKTYEKQVNALSLKSEFKADWGNHLVNSIANLRAFFTLGNGFTPQIKRESDKAERTLQFVKEFISHNDLDDATTQIWVKEENIEGKTAVIISPDTEDRGDTWLSNRDDDDALNPQVRARLLPWTQHGYVVESEPEDYTRYISLKYKDSAGEEIEKGKDEFIYARFGGRIAKINDSPPVMAAVINAIENLDKALTDWRMANHLYASATPHLNFESEEMAKKAATRLNSRSWRIGKLLITAKAEFALKGIPEAGLESLEKEITMQAKIVSGSTGVPVQFFGLPDLLSNRSTADNLMEQIVASVNGERRIWKTFFEELIRKAIRLANKQFNAALDENAIEVNIVEMSSLQLHRLTQVYVPLLLAKVISKETVLEKVPGIDKVKEKDRLDAEQKEDDERLAKEMGLKEPVISTSNNQGRNF